MSKTIALDNPAFIPAILLGILGAVVMAIYLGRNEDYEDWGLVPIGIASFISGFGIAMLSFALIIAYPISIAIAVLTAIGGIARRLKRRNGRECTSD